MGMGLGDNKRLRPRKPVDTAEFRLTAFSDIPVGIVAPFRIHEGATWGMGLRKAKRLHAWLGRAIDYLEEQERRKQRAKAK